MWSFTSLLVLATAVLTSASPLASRDAGTALLVNDLKALDRAIKNATAVTAAYQGGRAQYEPLREAFAEGIRRNRIAYNDAMTIAPQTVDESNQIIAVVANPIQPDITEAVNVLISKKALIDAAGLTQETATTLNDISSDHDTLSLAVGAKLSPATLPEAAPPVLQIDFDWRRGVVAFGGIPLAPLQFPET